MTIIYYTDDSTIEVKQLTKDVKNRGYSKIRIYRGYNHKGKKINLGVRVSFKGLSQFILNIKKDLNIFLMNSPENIKTSYLKGYSAAEGCASIAKSGSRYITISQNDKEELEFIKTLLKEIGIERIDGPRWGGTAFRISTSNGADLERFQNRIGFGVHALKNEKLKYMIDSYKQKRWHNDRYKGKV